MSSRQFFRDTVPCEPKGVTPLGDSTVRHCKNEPFA